MPFAETCRMEARARMLAGYDSGNWSVSELCRRYGVCRDTFYEWQGRGASGTSDCFTDRSHAPLHCRHETDAALKDAIVALQQALSPFGTAQAAVEAQARGARDGLAGGDDGRGDPQAGRADHSREAPA